jgi:hypothetical protein
VPRSSPFPRTPAGMPSGSPSSSGSRLRVCPSGRAVLMRPRYNRNLVLQRRNNAVARGQHKLAAKRSFNRARDTYPASGLSRPARRSTADKPGAHCRDHRCAVARASRQRPTLDHVYDRVRNFLVRRHEVPSRGTNHFHHKAVFGALRVRDPVRRQRGPRSPAETAHRRCRYSPTPSSPSRWQDPPPLT